MLTYSFAFPSNINCLSTRNNSFEEVLGSHPNTVCQICFAPGHTVVGCPQCYTLSQLNSVPAFATFNPVDANESAWYPDTVVASHMTLRKVFYSLKLFMLAMIKFGLGMVLFS